MDTSVQKRIEQFIAIIQKVKASSFVQKTKNVGYQMNFEAGQPLKQEVVGFDEDALRSMLLDLRKVLLVRDGVYFPEICSLIIANTANQDVKRNVQKCVSLYETVLQEPAIKMVINSVNESGEDVLNKWLYGHYFHEKQHNLDLQNLGVGLPLHRINFVIAITDLIKICSWVANNAKLVIATN